jgi:hypothetical protein
MKWRIATESLPVGVGRLKRYNIPSILLCWYLNVTKVHTFASPSMPVCLSVHFSEILNRFTYKEEPR